MTADNVRPSAAETMIEGASYSLPENSRATHDGAYRSETEPVDAGTRVERVVDYCADPEQSLTTYRVVGVAGVSVAINLVLAVVLLFVVFQKPRMIVVDRTAGGDRVVMMDDREFGLTNGVEFSPERLTAGGKTYLVRNYLELLFANNPDFRERQLEAAIKLMVAENGRKFFRYLKERRILEQQAAESWQATWSPQSITVDPKDPFTLRAIGIQKLRRVVNGTPIDETHQMNVRVRVVKDPLGRDDRNMHTGYLVDLFDWDELKNPNVATSGDGAPAAAGVSTATALSATN